ncbi:MAG: hypothetical protein H6667_06315 [Ardenticatenaceae bacterium]|nr:hypothetical protein [Ardenticatenaceae bacterium]MCB9442795.1 hypothetical protein [Ardenticatenaceae bacterium]
MSDSRLMIVMDEKSWTLAALHFACIMARREQLEVLLLKMVPVNHPLLLGTTISLQDFSSNEMIALADMAATAEDYGVCLQVQSFQYVSFWSGIVDAAGQLGATAVIAYIPPSPVPYWQELHRWLLRRLFNRQHKLLITLDDLTPTLTWTSSRNLQDDLAFKLSQHMH